jgi:hypothetical protein
MQQQISLGSWPRAELERLGEKTKRPMERVLIESYDSQKAMSSFNIASATVHEFGNVRPPNSPARRLPEKAYRHWHPWQPSQERQRQVRTNRHCSIGCGQDGSAALGFAGEPRNRMPCCPLSSIKVVKLS